MQATLHVSELWRYPVKSMLGERLARATLEARGITGDRVYAVEDRDGKFGSGKTTRRFRLLKGLFDFEARTLDGNVLVALPDGRELLVGSEQLDAALSARYGEELRVTPERSVSHFDVAAVHLVTTASLRWLGSRLGREVEAHRVRPNLLVAAPGAALSEEEWVGSELRVGTCVLRVTSTTERCVMVNNSQREPPADARVLRALAQLNDAQLGVYAEVVSPGVVCEGDAVHVEGT